MESVSLAPFIGHGPWRIKRRKCLGFENIIMHKVFVNGIHASIHAICKVVSLLFVINIDWSGHTGKWAKRRIFQRNSPFSQNSKPKLWNTTLLNYVY